tara:strand:- start:3760 stop:4233 length:474 start_codon:yes stop_codon:yes gene_type:complete
MFLFYIIILILILEIISGLYRQYNRITEYNKAYQLSKKLNKPLLVIGDPNNGFMSKILGLTYPCGDLCLDIVGCKGCKNQIEGDALQELKKMKDNSYIIFESCVLEYIQYNKLVREEILRVSGNKYFEVRIGLSLINLGYYPGGLLTNESTKIYSVE